MSYEDFKPPEILKEASDGTQKICWSPSKTASEICPMIINKLTLGDLKRFLNTEIPRIAWSTIAGNQDLTNSNLLSYREFVRLVQRVAIRHNRLMPAHDYSNMTTLNSIITYVNNTEPPKDREGKERLLREREIYYLQ